MERMNIDRQTLIEGIERITGGLSGRELAARLKEAHASGLEKICLAAAGRWHPGKGASLGKALASLKEAVVAKILDSLSWDREEVCVVAIGGLGREELAPGSDLDVLILHRNGVSVEEFARGFLYVLWDGGFEVTASSRTVEDCLAHAREDETFFTALLSARPLAGSVALYAFLMRRFRRLVRPLGMRLAAGWLDETRSAVNGAASPRQALFVKEPNLKRAPGGLRAFHMLEWLAAILFDRPDPGLLCSPPELRRLAAARDFILYVRILLHATLGGKEDTLALDYQLGVARRLGLGGADADAIRCLMGFYYRKILVVNRILYRSLEDAVIRFRPWLSFRMSRHRRSPFFSLGGALFASAGLAPSPAAAFDLLERLAGGRLLFSASASAFLESCARLPQPDGWRAMLRERLAGLLALEHSSRSLRAMHFTGLLHIAVPVLAPVRLFYLYSPAHLFPVDLHSIESVAALERLYADEPAAADSRFVSPVREVAAQYRERAWVLKLALLLHDAGKGFPGDHAQNGVEAAARFLPGLSTARQYRDAVLFLIEHHLLLSNAVRRRDTTDSRVLEDLARVFIRSPYPEEYLDLLFIFTYADAWATHPRNYNGYFAFTLMRVYQKVREFVMDSPRGRSLLTNAEERFPAEAEGDSALAAFARTMGEHYLENNADAEVARDFRILDGLAPGGFEVAVRAGAEFVKVKFYASDRPGLFALLAGILSLNGAAIVRADIHTCAGKALDEFAVTRIFESDAHELSAAGDATRWEAALRRDYDAYRDDISRLSAQLAALRQKTRGLGARFAHAAHIAIVPGEAGGARIEITGRDRPALLFDLAWALALEKVDVRSALIDTTGWSVQDIFEVEFERDRQVGLREKLQTILEKIIEAADNA
jgi:[protein-PII] uridylyltransferase